MAARRVIDAVAAPTRRTPLQSTKLRDQAGVFEQFDLAGIDGWQEPAIQIVLGRGRLVVGDAMAPEHLDGPQARVAIAHHLVDAVALQDTGELLNGGLGGEWR